MEFIIKKENEKFEYYHENVNIPYNKMDASDAKGKSRVGAIEDLGKRDDFNDSEKKSSF